VLERVHLVRANCFFGQAVYCVIPGIIAVSWDPLETERDPTGVQLPGRLEDGLDDALPRLVRSRLYIT
jgi:hypothetical protein